MLRTLARELYILKCANDHDSYIILKYFKDICTYYKSAIEMIK